MSGSRRVVAGGPPKAPDDRRQSLLLGWEPEPAPAPVSAPEASAQERAALRVQVAASKQAFTATVAVRLSPEAAHRIRWARGPLPVIANLRDVRFAHVFDGLDRRRLLDDA